MKVVLNGSFATKWLIIIILSVYVLSGCQNRSGAVPEISTAPDVSDLAMTDSLRLVFSERRGRLTDQIEDGIIIISSGSFPSGSHCEYRVNDNFFYLTGFDQPMSAVAIKKNTPGTFILFLRERNMRDIIYSGGAHDNDEILTTYGFDTVISYRELNDFIKNSIAIGTPIYIDFRDRMLRGSLLPDAGKPGMPGNLVRDIGPVIEEMRVFKDEIEISRIQKAIDITGEAFINSCHVCRPGMYEFEIEALIEYTFRRNGSARPAFESITGSGPNTVTLHYSDNNRKMEDGDLLLMDVGAEYGYYAADISRTIPVNGKFTREQREIYDLVLKAQEAAIMEMLPGKPLYAGHPRATSVIARGLYDLGLLTDTSSTWQKEFYTLYQINHYLGLGVHDAGDYGLPGAFIRDLIAVDTAIGRPLKEGMVLTVEPGIYLRENGLDMLFDTFRGRATDEEIKEFIDRVGPVYNRYVNIGVRIEDDVLITGDGNLVLSKGIPKDPDEIEILMSRKKR